MKKIAKDLKTIARQLNSLAQKTETLAKAFETVPKKAAPKKAAPRAAKKKPAPRVRSLTPTDQVLTIMKRFKKGISVEALRTKSGFNEKQISNIVHRACKKGKMKRVSRGLYSVYDK
jgi:septal ring factor EnvC (AmiA/AmiB activator)